MRNFLTVTERGGELVSSAQLQRLYQRYLWAGSFCRGKDVLEMACGTGPGLGYLRAVSRTLCAGDLSREVLDIASAHYGERIRLQQFDAVATPYPDRSFDVILLFEALYYLPDVRAFVREVSRLLRPGGVLLLATANKDLFDFNPSPFSHRYLNPPELAEMLGQSGFSARFYGGSPVPRTPVGVLLRAVKRAAVSFRLIPRSMKGKRLLKRLVFGKLVEMPREIGGADLAYVAPVSISSTSPDCIHQVLYCVASKGSD